jgi:FolB domain-containing protein
MNSDVIAIRGLELWCHIGVPEEERRQPQRLLASIQMVTDCAAAARSDDVADALDYARVAEAVKEVAAARPRKLLETLADDIARRVLERFSPQSITVELEKFPLKDARGVSVTITRTKYA